jgi:DNA-binding transcriptional MerR regulator
MLFSRKEKRDMTSTKLEIETRWDSQWQTQYEHLLKFHAKTKAWPKVTTEFPAGNRIGQWVNRQRDLFERGELSADRIKLLRKAGFSWGKVDERASHWDEQFQNLLTFRKTNRTRWPFAREDFPKGNRLGLWVWRQRQAEQRGQLPEERRKQLEKIKFPFELPDAWEQHYETLKNYRVKSPDQWPKAREEFPKGNRLGLWCHLQRCAHKAGTLAKPRIKALEKLGFQWSVKNVSWMRFYNLLKDYKKANPKRWPVLDAGLLTDRRLIAWCSTQRHKYKVGKLDAEKSAMLERLKFRW